MTIVHVKFQAVAVGTVTKPKKVNMYDSTRDEIRLIRNNACSSTMSIASVKPMSLLSLSFHRLKLKMLISVLGNYLVDSNCAHLHVLPKSLTWHLKTYFVLVSNKYPMIPLTSLFLFLLDF